MVANGRAFINFGAPTCGKRPTLKPAFGFAPSAVREILSAGWHCRKRRRTDRLAAELSVSQGKDPNAGAVWLNSD